jgi:thiamine biosynthesis lipoprotein
MRSFVAATILLALGLTQVSCDSFFGRGAPSPVTNDLSRTVQREASPEPVKAATATPRPAGLVTRNGSAMGTEVRISVWTDDEEKADPAIAQAFDEIQRLENLMTTWKPDSEVSRINEAAGEHPVQVSDDTLEVIEMAQKASQLSGGAFDISFYALHGLWKFDEDLEKKIPDKKILAHQLKLVDYRQIKVDHDKKTVFLAKKGMGIGLGGIAKGYAVDRAVKVLREKGFPNAIVQAGGDLMCAGTKGGGPWTAGIRDPRGGRSDVFATLKLMDHAFSTAGDYERYFFLDGKRYHHIIDTKTGFPSMKSRSVTIYAPTALLADALDDAVFIMGWKAGIDLVESIDDVGAVVVDDKGEVHVSSRVKNKLDILRKPTNEP